MLRLLAHVALALLANAVGLLVAAALLGGFDLTVQGFVLVVALYSFLTFLLDPLVVKLSIKYIPAFRGGVALVTTFVSLFITNIISDGISVDGIATWAVATLVVWLFGVIASLLLPLVLFKKIVNGDDDKKSSKTESKEA